MGMCGKAKAAHGGTLPHLHGSHGSQVTLVAWFIGGPSYLSDVYLSAWSSRAWDISYLMLDPYLQAKTLNHALTYAVPCPIYGRVMFLDKSYLGPHVQLIGFLLARESFFVRTPYMPGSLLLLPRSAKLLIPLQAILRIDNRHSTRASTMRLHNDVDGTKRQSHAPCLISADLREDLGRLGASRMDVAKSQDPEYLAASPWNPY
ncbi:hypothetical protein VNO77_44207 [Canavalia gladiata]|uniref:Uncharacterized protein n=1 Tax=Canavalia gladiata TaxID=3824 RepID=A0AAN9JVM0_CANGL